ncbi:type IV secretory system conjugative DNA transfer family protein [Streptomyces sp. AV19]|uniref:type IV secretory system conjugative DNA transfer family protein n=1 Tax=Streptomyces sp. AV19 TaxID=2793068 RepID=UPI0018FEFA57|nr:TraM recognition domain-containing protein [Streptomyces sp. AV19]MBH1934132.1 type IV secretory system conjugative DNA transfer family protein [Streptomyces sp. AV19]MDG4537146.1 TraM recognition domain-containing protein [Streptomyces sp. AV19]
MSSTTKRRGPGDEAGPYVLLGALLLLVVLGAAAWAAASLGAALGDAEAPPGPFALPFALAHGTYRWPGAWATAVLVAEVLVLAVAGGLVARAVLAARRRRHRIDAAAPHLAKGRELDKLTWNTVTQQADRWGVPAPDPSDGIQADPGVFIGRSVIGDRPLYGSLEDMHVDVWGPRTGKTTRRAIPAVCRAGRRPVYVTSNKRDVVDATRGVRAQFGRIFVFDLQGLIGEAVSWWWNPLGHIEDVAAARRLASHFASDRRKPTATTDAYFEPAGQDLLAYFFLAAALDKRPITQAYRWLSNSRDGEPERILRAAGPEFLLPADAVKSVLNAPEKQRGGIYGTALQMASCLVDPKVTRWVTDNGRGLPEFDPDAYVAGTDTLYMISREGTDSAGALVTALTVAVCEAGERLASGSPHGRHPAAMLGVLDEAANVCRWADLPDKYSHYGSRGMPVMTILQSWEQGVEVWGEHGMAKLWGSANIRVYGGGGASPNFLGNLSKMAGGFEAPTFSTSRQPGGNGPFGFSTRSNSQSSREDEIVSVSDLGGVSPGRALLVPSGSRPTLIRTVPWWEQPHIAPAVSASLAKYDPGAI